MDTIACEKRTVELMIRLYCRRCEGNEVLCERCRELLAYAHARLDNCPWNNHKPNCKDCSIHCYRSDMRTRMREVMRSVGSLMMLHHPLLALRHLFAGLHKRRTR